LVAGALTASAFGGVGFAAWGALPETTGFFTALAIALTSAFGAAGAAALAALLALAVLPEAPLAAEFLIDAAARGEAEAARAVVLAAVFAFVVALVLVTFFDGAFALLVFAAVFADLAADLTVVREAVFATALAVVLAAAFASVLARAVDALPLAADLGADLPAAALALDFPAVAAVRDRTVLGAFFATEPREREADDVTPAPFFFSFFVADGIRGTLLLRPAVETGRNCRPLTVPRKTAWSASLSI